MADTVQNFDYNDLDLTYGGEPIIVKLGNDTEISTFEPDVAKVVIALIICIVGLIGNLVAIFVILVLKEYQKSVTHWYVLQLAIADSIFLLTLPFKVSEDLNGQWIFPEWMCKGKETILFLNYYASILFLMIMSFDRYVAVCHPFSETLQKLRKRASAFIIAVILWAASLLLCIPVMLYSFKVGFWPNCKCSYEFPSFESHTAQCIQEGFTSPEAIEGCLKLFNVEVIDGEFYCTRHISDDNSFFAGLGNNSIGDYDDNYGSLVFEALSSNNTNLQPASLVSDSRSDDETVHGDCNYWDRPVGWIAFLAFNFTVMFIVPLIVMVVCYGLIVRRLSETQRRTTSVSSNGGFTPTANASSLTKKKRKWSSRSDKDRRRVTIMCATLVSSFVVCWLPFHAVHLAKIVGIPNTEPYICNGWLAAGSLLGYLNSALNPYLYSFLGTNFTRRWRLLKKSHGIRQFISMAAWKQGDSSGSNRQYQSKNGRNRNVSQQLRQPVAKNHIRPPSATMSTKVSMSKTGDISAPPPMLSGTHLVPENHIHQHLFLNPNIEMDAAAQNQI